MTADEQWLAAVETGHPTGHFGHREHLLLAWLVLEREVDVERAEDRVSHAIRAIANAHGRPQRFNRTVTDSWVRIMRHCRAHATGAGFDDAISQYPWLLDKRLLMRHYSSSRLAGVAARARWIEPDLLPIPA